MSGAIIMPDFNKEKLLRIKFENEINRHLIMDSRFFAAKDVVDDTEGV